MTSLFGGSPFPNPVGPQSVMDFGALGDGQKDDTFAFNLAIAYFTAIGGGYCKLNSDRTFKISSRITCNSNTGFYGDRTAKVYAPSTYFNNSTQGGGGLYQSNSAVFDCSGQLTAPYTPSSNVRLTGFTIYSDSVVTTSATVLRICDAITARNCFGLRLTDLEIYNFPAGSGIRAASLRNQCVIDGNYIHDFYDNSAGWLANGYNQVTGIWLDGDRVVNGTAICSNAVSIQRNVIQNMLLGAISSASPGGAWQTDGITLDGPDSASTGNWSVGHQVGYNIISEVGEAIDCIGPAHVSIFNNKISHCHFFGIKMGHGATSIIASDNDISYYGLAAYVMYGGGGGPNTQYNLVHGGTVSNGNPILVSTGLREWAVNLCNALRTQGTGDTNIVTNCLFRDITVVADTNIDSVIKRGSDGSNINYKDITTYNTGASGKLVTTTAETGYIKDANPTNIKLTLGADQAIPINTQTKINFDTKIYDTRGEFSGGNITLDYAGMYTVSGCLRFSVLTVTDELDIRVLGSSSGALESRQYHPSTANNNSFPFSFDVPLRQGETVEIDVLLTSGTGRSVTGNATLTTLSVKQTWN